MKMKKLLSICLAACLAFALGASLTSCFHKCGFSTEWSHDETAHWHACTGEDCDKVADKADHTWDEGRVTTKATQEAEGVKTYTCTVCKQTKTEGIVFTGMTESEWDSAFRSMNFKNFSYTEMSTVKGSGVTVETETVYKFTDNRAWVKVTIAGRAEESYITNSYDVDSLNLKLVLSLKELVPYASYTYDAETKTYKANEKIYVEQLNASTSDITLTFADDRLAKLEYAITFRSEGIDFTTNSTVILSDYGEVEIDSNIR